MDIQNSYVFMNCGDSAAYIPLGMIASVHSFENEDDKYKYSIVVTTVSGREFENKFSSFERVTEFCDELMQKIFDYHVLFRKESS